MGTKSGIRDDASEKTVGLYLEQPLESPRQEQLTRDCEIPRTIGPSKEHLSHEDSDLEEVQRRALLSNPISQHHPLVKIFDWVRSPISQTQQAFTASQMEGSQMEGSQMEGSPQQTLEDCSEKQKDEAVIVDIDTAAQKMQKKQ
ncbi:hypothetical protein LTR66_015886 [Elasticomyces elasticus]|nr:hypothetical protein LTR66_015886 [Elasticomyces elasticus]